jgi:hypothetical protein
MELGPYHKTVETYMRTTRNLCLGLFHRLVYQSQAATFRYLEPWPSSFEATQRLLSCRQSKCSQ